MNRLNSCLFFVFLTFSAACAETRIWQTHTGKTLEAELVEVSGGFAVFKDKAGKLFRILISRMDRQDAERIRAWKLSLAKQVDMKPKSRATDTGQDRLRELEMKAAERINQQREKHGLSPLKFDHRAAAVARAHSRDMVNRDYFSHTAKDGRSPSQRMRDGGLKFRRSGENIAINDSSSGATTAWMNSSGHRANILNRKYTRTGMGIWRKEGRLYFTQVFMN